MDRMTSYQVQPIDAEVLRQLRDHDDAGAPPRLVVDEDGGSPLRCCFTRAKPHETVALVSYAPLRRWAGRTGADPGPYDETGPVFIHADDCGGPDGSGFPEDMLGARRVLRAYGTDGSILDGRYVETGDRTAIESELDDLYRDPEVAAVHLRAVEFGCFLVETRRS
jgi:hypothetical protein